MEYMQHATHIEEGQVLQLDLADVDLLGNLNELIRSNRDRSRGLEFQLRNHNIPKYVSVDPCIFKHVLQPLLNFVAAYAPEGSKVDVCVFQAVNYFTFKIDFITYVDLDAEVVMRRFHNYYVTDGDIRGFAAIGLGLFVASNLIQSMGGSLEYYSESNEALFQFNLSLKAAHIAPTFTPRAAMKWSTIDSTIQTSEDSSSQDGKTSNGSLSKHNGVIFSADVICEARSISEDHDFLGLSNGRQLRILVVDDSDMCKRMLCKALEQVGYATDSANNGKEALKLLSITPCIFDAVIMDVVMPIMNGITAIREIRQNLKLTNIPIVILTASVSDEIRSEAMAAGASDFVLKPVYSTSIINCLASHGVISKVPVCA